MGGDVDVARFILYGMRVQNYLDFRLGSFTSLEKLNFPSVDKAFTQFNLGFIWTIEPKSHENHEFRSCLDSCIDLN